MTGGTPGGKFGGASVEATAWLDRAATLVWAHAVVIERSD